MHIDTMRSAKIQTLKDILKAQAPTEAGDQDMEESPAEDGDQDMVEAPTGDGDQDIEEAPAEDGDPDMLQTPADHGVQDNEARVDVKPCVIMIEGHILLKVAVDCTGSGEELPASACFRGHYLMLLLS